MQAIRAFKNFLRVLSPQTFIVILLAWGAIFICLNLNFTVELPTSLIGIAIIFPIVFSINAAYRRREQALASFASFKAHAIALYYAHRDWPPQDGEAHGRRMQTLFDQMLVTLQNYFTEKQGQAERFQEMYARFSDLSKSMETLRSGGLSNSEVSRANQYLRAMVIDYERMRNILLYRTPLSLRSYSQVFLNIFPILFAPYFADLSTQHFYSLGFWLAALYGLILVSLDNIQEDLENPFDKIGEDDIDLAVNEIYQRALAGAGD